MRLYLSGKITGKENYKEDFARERARLEAAGYAVCDPTAFDFPEDVAWEYAMKYGISEMLACDGVAVLADWQDSRGARIEARLAEKLGMPVLPVAQWLEKGEGREMSEKAHVRGTGMRNERTSPLMEALAEEKARISAALMAVGYRTIKVEVTQIGTLGDGGIDIRVWARTEKPNLGGKA